MTSRLKLFIGYELEGPLQGLPTLFVQGKVPTRLIVDQLLKHTQPSSIGVKHVYFGAGGVTDFDLLSVKAVLDSRTPYVEAVTIEAPSRLDDWLGAYDRVYQMLPVTANGVLLPETLITLDGYATETQTELFRRRVFVKYDTGNTVGVSPLPSFVVNDFSQYHLDRTVWEPEPDLGQGTSKVSADTLRQSELTVANTTEIWVTFSKVGFHAWPSAAGDVSYLANKHRHKFNFKVSVPVTHDDRQIEFHQFLGWCSSRYDTNSLQLDNASCEMLAKDLANSILATFDVGYATVSVDEDGECGATVTAFKVEP